MAYALTHMGNFFLLLLRPPLQVPVLRLKFQSPGPNLSLQAQIRALRPKSEPQGPNLSLEAQFPALRPKSQPEDPSPSQEVQTLT